MRMQCSVCGAPADSICKTCGVPLCNTHACVKQPGGLGYFCAAHVPPLPLEQAKRSEATPDEAKNYHVDDLVLTIELVPRPCWYSNLRQNMTRAAWDTLRRQVYREGGFRCGVCGAKGVLHCHERWEYDDTNHIQRLAGFIALCEWCHHVKHIGHAGILAAEGKLDMDRVIAHFKVVNNCDHTAFLAHRDAAFERWRARNQHHWRTDLGEYQESIDS